MAKQLRKFTPKLKPGPRAKYPWDEWLKPIRASKEPGEIWRLRQGPDFTCSLTSMEAQIRMRAAERGLRVGVHREAEGVVLINYGNRRSA